MDNKLDINVTEKKVSDENMLKTVEEALMKNELCLNTGRHRRNLFEIAKCFACRLFEDGKSNRL